MKYNVKTLLFSRQMHCYAEESQQTHHPIECKNKHKQKKKNTNNRNKREIA